MVTFSPLANRPPRTAREMTSRSARGLGDLLLGVKPNGRTEKVRQMDGRKSAVQEICFQTQEPSKRSYRDKASKRQGRATLPGATLAAHTVAREHQLQARQATAPLLDSLLKQWPTRLQHQQQIPSALARSPFATFETTLPDPTSRAISISITCNLNPVTPETMIYAPANSSLVTRTPFLT